MSSHWTYTPNCRVPEGQHLPEGVRRFAAALEYDGSRFCGWQTQKHSPSVQAEVNRALSRVADQNILTVCAGRTDTGVHATNQIVHFDTTATRNPVNWLKGANSGLPNGIRFHQVCEVPAQFHARFSAVSRTYRYIIDNRPVKPAILANAVTWYRQPLKEAHMHQAAQQLLGEQDFSAFRATGCQSDSPFRNVLAAKVWRQGQLVIFEITANAFLYHMVRNLVGALLAVGRGQLSIVGFADLLASRDRTIAPATATADGLYLVAVSYSETNPFFKTLQKGPEFIFAD